MFISTMERQYLCRCSSSLWTTFCPNNGSSFHTTDTSLKILHYLDGFIFVSGSSEKADSQKQLLIDTFKTLGVPLETLKLEGLATCLTFLGIEFDTVSLQICLPPQKFSNLKSELSQAVSHKRITKKLQSLVGLLQK